MEPFDKSQLPENLQEKLKLFEDAQKKVTNSEHNLFFGESQNRINQFLNNPLPEDLQKNFDLSGNNPLSENIYKSEIQKLKIPLLSEKRSELIRESIKNRIVSEEYYFEKSKNMMESWEDIKNPKKNNQTKEQKTPSVANIGYSIWGILSIAIGFAIIFEVGVAVNIVVPFTIVAWLFYIIYSLITKR